MKEETKFHEVSISDIFYNDYKRFKDAIFENLVKNNCQFDKLTLFKKSQRLLDRFLFVLFAEDIGLCPPNSIQIIIDQWKRLQDDDIKCSLYSRFQKMFGYLDKGHKGKHFEFPVYNGGLFKSDELLDNEKIVVEDFILLEHCPKLSAYDFSTEIDVNILGHIFEHSLNEIEEISAELMATTGHAPLSKRKKDGIFYTPKYITSYIVENTIGKLCKDKQNELQVSDIEINESYNKNGKITKQGKELYAKFQNYKNWLLTLRILDPACGSGAFLNSALDFLIKEHKQIDDLISNLTGDKIRMFDTDKNILENNIFGVDINEESVEIAKLSLWLRTAKKDRKLSDLNNNIKCGNSLIDSKEIAGEKAFDWQKEFPQVFIEKKKKAWHITTATHNSRYSQRMFDNHVKLGEAIWLTEKEEVIIAQTLADIVKKDNLNIPAFNICGDHMHLILVCEENEMSKIVGKIKSMSARACNIAMGRTISGNPATRGHAPLSKTDAPLSETDAPLSEIDASLSEKKYENERGETQAKLWTQKFGQKEIISDEQLYNTINYINNNREKHELPSNPEIQKLTKQLTCSIENAFRIEYSGGFDVIIGNPPYVRQENLNKTEKDYLSKHYEVGNGVADLYVYFYNIGINLLKQNGILGYITPNKWFKTKYGFNLRNFIKQFKIIEIYDFFELRIFQDASTEPQIIIIQNNKNSDNFNYYPVSSTNEFISCQVKPSIINKNNLNSDSWILSKNDNHTVLSKIYENTISLLDYSNQGVYRGIMTGLNKAFIIDETTKDKILKDDPKSAELIKKYISGTDIGKWNLNFKNEYIIFTRRGTDIENYPSIKKYLLQFYEELRPRNNNEPSGRKPGKYQWFEIQDSVDYYLIFEESKIIYIRTAVKHNFFIDYEKYYTNDSCYIIANADKFLACWLNSNIFIFLKRLIFVAYGNASEKGRAKLDYNKMVNIPIPILTEQEKQPFCEKADIMLTLNKELQSKIDKLIKRIKSNFANISITNKLSNFYEQDFNTFIAELKKQKVIINLKIQDEWEEYFDSYKKEIKDLQHQIKSTEKMIDKMIYEIYKLTPEEIALVERTDFS
jgi:REP element-mobilizing transposase RayT